MKRHATTQVYVTQSRVKYYLGILVIIFLLFGVISTILLYVWSWLRMQYPDTLAWWLIVSWLIGGILMILSYRLGRIQASGLIEGFKLAIGMKEQARTPPPYYEREAPEILRPQEYVEGVIIEQKMLTPGDDFIEM